MLEDFYNMFPTEEVLGVSAPLSAGMVAGTAYISKKTFKLLVFYIWYFIGDL